MDFKKYMFINELKHKLTVYEDMIEDLKYANNKLASQNINLKQENESLRNRLATKYGEDPNNIEGVDYNEFC